MKFRGDPLFNGAQVDAFQGKVFINVDSAKPFMAVLGHELLHSMRVEQPGLYAQLEFRLSTMLADPGRYRDRLELAYAKHGLKAPANWMEELHADVVGDFFQDAQFWADMAKDQPGLFKRVVSAILKFLDDVAQKIGNLRPFGTEQYLSDINAAREAVAHAMRQFSGAQVGAMTSQADGINLSITDELKSAAKAGDIRATVMTMMGQTDKLTTFNAWHKTVGTPYHKANARDSEGNLVAPGYKKAFDEAQEYLHDTSTFANDPAALAPDVLPQLNGWRDVAPKMLGGTGRPLVLKADDHTKLASAVFTGTTEDKRIYSDTELASRFGMNERQRDLYRQTLAAIGRSMDTLVASDVARYLGEAVPPGMRAMIQDGDIGRFRGLVMALVGQRLEDAKQNLAAAKSRAKAMLSDYHAMQKQKLASIKPGSRLSIEQELDDAKAAVDANISALMQEAEAQHAAAQRDHEHVSGKYERIDKLKNEGYAPLMRFGMFTVDVVDAEGNRPFFRMYESKAEARLAARALRLQYPDHQVVTGSMDDERFRQFAGMTPETAELFADLAGVEKTPLFEEFIKLTKSQRSPLKRLIQRKGIAGYSEDVQRMLASFITSNARAASANLHAGAIQRAVETIPQTMGDVRKDARRLQEYVQTPQEEAQAIRGLLFAQYLGGSVAAAMVNMTQPLMMTLPYLSQFGGLGKAAGQLVAALKGTLGGPMDAQLRHDLTRAEKDGVVSPQQIHQLHAQATQQYGNHPVVRKGMFAWGGLFALAEQFNRRLTFIAAYNLAREQKEADPFAFASKAVDETQGIYNRGNRPNWARGAVGSTVFTFKQYSISYLEFLKRLPKRERAIAIALLILAAGTQGLPFADDLDDLIDTLAQHAGYDISAKEWKTQALESAFGEFGADVIQYGFSAIPGMPIDVAGRLGMANVVPGTGILLKSRQNKAGEVFEVIGPAGGLVKDALAGEFFPKALKDLGKALEMYQTGEYRDKAGRKVIETGEIDALAKGIGFQPAEVARESRAMRMKQQRISITKAAESEIAALWAQGLADREPAKVQEAREKLVEWNRKNPQSPIAISRAQLLKRVRDLRSTRSERLLKSAPKEMRQSL